jgi:hypothetical protein
MISQNATGDVFPSRFYLHEGPVILGDWTPLDPFMPAAGRQVPILLPPGVLSGEVP